MSRPKLDEPHDEPASVQVVVVEWSTKKLSQSSPFVSVSNTLTLLIKGSISLASSSSGDLESIITLSGLTGVTALEHLLLTVTRFSGTSWVSAGVLFCGDSTALTINKGGWGNNALVLPVCAGKTVLAGVTYAIAFAVTNPSTQQDAPAISISASGRR